MPLSRLAFSAPAPEAARPIVSARTRPLLSNRRVEPLPSLAALLICAAPVPLFAQADTAPQPDSTGCGNHPARHRGPWPG